MPQQDFDIQTAVPWGRSLDEYTRMFSLDDRDFSRHILDCGGGPASFNAEMTTQRRNVVSVDPIYAFEPAQIEQRVRETYPKVMDGVRRAHDRFVWKDIRSPEHLGEIRLQAMHRFLEDIPVGKSEGRYIAAELPTLPFADNSFELVLVSHLLFLYSEEMSFEFHLASLRELLRIAPEVRVFPLLAMDGKPSLHLNAITQQLVADGHICTQQRVNYEFQVGGHTMLVIQR